ncbi:hypothetical protein N7509_012919 [Penicillium cosmopolitanum]|uniref:Uncharacterized protein n=1 Tax=Penicillium cosmopolitanum TaxID=1131564 RepID=A0A9W9SH25_9EURO|nr:uncharacterized protein N7509_012919 [Penicillium cosmopolitanum]KAJ5376033.1 hypothetical protein N7509_012919 [Penicillium cosmopolitanum]
MNIAADERLDFTAVTNRGENGSGLSGQEEKLFKVLHDVVQPRDAITPDGAAEQINEYLRSHPNRSGEREEDTEVVGDFLGSLWSLLTSVVEYTPYNHPGQDRLIATMQSLIKRTEGSYAIWGVCFPKAKVKLDGQLLIRSSNLHYKSGPTYPY